MEARGLRALLCVLVVVASSIALVSAAAGATADVGTRRAALQESPEGDANDTPMLGEADQTYIDVFITENGSARMTVDYQFYLADENRSAEWEALEANVSSETDWYVAEERRSWNETLSKGENATDREMSLSNVSITTETTSRPEEIGHAKVSFEWAHFAHVQVNRLEAGAALSGFTLTDGTTLQFRWPEEYALYENEGAPQVKPSPDESAAGSVGWEGERNFPDDEPRVVLIRDSDAGTDEPQSAAEPSMPWTIVTLALALLATVGAAGWLLGRRRSDGEAAVAEDEAVHRPDGAVAAERTVPDGPPPELLSNEERVLRLLEERGGRVKQQQVVSELDWTEAKTSQVVGDLRENDEIEVFRIGRENVLTLPDDD
ncbi:MULTISPECIES: hypothetical protein [unclassified Natrinema]|uniref:helix-turn-helix transcriptional regulator n=1 Tax=unclassified Natrinema TaxID=2622230 RepID=UPI0002A84CF5|nr:MULTISPECIES: hypothetical protein [unclassified Natrinema]AFO55522.2 hypothetical protein NJ7G_0267 [Natrinema sp. J7-2]